jgi:pyrroloquinoline quinone (PQQ) biosynthesis protein C
MTSDQATSDRTVPGVIRPTGVAEAVTRALVGRELLTHPFYRRWEAGTLEPGELAEYAVHYRAFEAALPAVLTAVAAYLREEGHDGATASVERNLADELGRPEPHLALFDRFAGALATDGPATAAGPGPAAEALVGTYFDLVADGPLAALAGLVAYETQASAIAASKSEGLRRWYGMDAEGTAFWDVHAQMDAEHGEWATEALELLDADPADVNVAARRAAEAWWALLDERQAEAPGSAEFCSHH